ncbi:hypothetical protein ACQZV8_18135 [Magnetococcales bacterium HHB-1]
MKNSRYFQKSMKLRLSIRRQLKKYFLLDEGIVSAFQLLRTDCNLYRYLVMRAKSIAGEGFVLSGLAFQVNVRGDVVGVWNGCVSSYGGCVDE